jgi:hypothetical protein
VADNVSMAKDKAGPRVMPEVESKNVSKGKLLPNDSVMSAVETTNENIMPAAVEPPTLWFN